MTWSIVAVDPETREVGTAAASCTVGVEVIHRIVPGRGVIVAQAATNLRGRTRGARRIAEGRGAHEVVAEIATEAFNPGRLWCRRWSEQQYGVAVLGPEPEAANFTGSATVPWSGARADGVFSVQGNMLRDASVVGATFDAFAAADRRVALADRLIAALAAGAEHGGDHRCAPERGALAAFVAVARPDDVIGRPSCLLVAPRAYGWWGAIRHRLVPYRPSASRPAPVEHLGRMYRDR